MEVQNLGELKTVSNTLRDSHLETDDLIVGWVMVDGNITNVAFTKHELLRPVDRAKDNQEDLLTLVAKLPTHGELQDLREQIEKLFKKIDWLIMRSWWERLTNKMPPIEGHEGGTALKETR